MKKIAFLLAFFATSNALYACENEPLTQATEHLAAPLPEWTPLLHKLPGEYCRFSPDSTRVVTILGGNTVQIIDTITGALIQELPISNTWHAFFSSDGKSIITRNNDTLTTWDIASGNRLGESTDIPADSLLEFAGELFVFDDNDIRYFDPSFSDGTVTMRDAQTDKIIKKFKGPEGHRKFAQSVAVSPDGSIIATASSQESIVIIWETSSGKVLHRLSSPQYTIGVRDLAFNSAGDRLLAITEIKSFEPSIPRWERSEVMVINIWNPRTYELIETIQAELWSKIFKQKFQEKDNFDLYNIPTRAYFSPDGAIIASTTHEDKTLIFVNVQALAEKKLRLAQKQAFTCVLNNRLAVNSPAKHLPQILVQEICSLVHSAPQPKVTTIYTDHNLICKFAKLKATEWLLERTQIGIPQ